LALRNDPGQRLLWLGGVLALAASAYFLILRLTGMDIRAIVRR
jgi:hypothetical protein